MANIGLVIDPIGEDSANSPLPLIDATNGVRVTSFDAPTPELDSQWASSSDTEGEARAGFRYRNRTISVGVQVQEPTDTAATNLATNPKAAVGTTGVTQTSLTTFERVVLGSGSHPAWTSALPPGIDTAFHGVSDASSDRFEWSAAVTNGVTYRFSVYVYLASASTALILQVMDAGAVSKGVSTPAFSTTGVWTRLDVSVVANATATWTFRVRQDSPPGALDFYGTAALIEASSTLGPYFDGDTPGAAWTGVPNTSSSTRQAPGGDRFLAILNDLQAKTAKLAREGGTLRIVYPTGDTITCDVLEAALPAIPFDQHLLNSDLARVPLTFICKPFGRGATVTLSDHSETTLPVLIFTETGIKGDVPATVEITVDNDVAVAKAMALWGLRSRYYDPAATAALFYQAESLTPAGTAATAVGTAGASGAGSNVMKEGTLSGTALTAMLTTGTLTHVGSYRVFARVYAPAANAGSVSVAFEWIGPTTVATRNATVSAATEAAWQLVDLGQIHLPQAAFGTHQWSGSLLAMSTTAGDDLEVDWLLFLPILEGAGEVAGLPTFPALYASSSLMLSSEGVFSQLSTAWRRPYKYEGDYPLLPPAGREGRTLEVAIKLTGVGFTDGIAPDTTTDDLSSRITYTPRYLVVPKP